MTDENVLFGNKHSDYSYCNPMFNYDWDFKVKRSIIMTLFHCQANILYVWEKPFWHFHHHGTYMTADCLCKTVLRLWMPPREAIIHLLTHNIALIIWLGRHILWNNISKWKIPVKCPDRYEPLLTQRQTWVDSQFGWLFFNSQIFQSFDELKVLFIFLKNNVWCHAIFICEMVL